MRKLRRLAWIWSLENLLLSAAVYHRLFIYIGFNGMTRLRIVGLFGISLVVAGFLLVIWKIIQGKDFVWLMRRQTWAFAATVYLFALLPIDALAVMYNTSRILRGDSSAAMQIGVQPLDTEGILALSPLLQAPDAEIREGVKARLADAYTRLTSKLNTPASRDWTAYQAAEQLLLRRLEALRPAWRPYENATAREQALARFYDYAYQWY